MVGAGLHPSRPVHLPAAALLLTTLTGLLSAQTPRDSLVSRAIAAAGGTAALGLARALSWEGDAVVHLPGRDIRLGGTWRILPPDSAVVTTFETEKGPASSRRLILAGDRGWLQRDANFTPLSAELIAEERHQFYLYSLLRLLPLRSASLRVSFLLPDSAGHPGLRVEAPNRLPVNLYFDDDGRIVRLVTAFATVNGAGDAQEIQLSGTVEAGGIRWFQRLAIWRAGLPYFDLAIRSLTTGPGLADSLFAGPP